MYLELFSDGFGALGRFSVYYGISEMKFQNTGEVLSGEKQISV
jgi:hypothetical protein